MMISLGNIWRTVPTNSWVHFVERYHDILSGHTLYCHSNIFSVTVSSAKIHHFLKMQKWSYVSGFRVSHLKCTCKSQWDGTPAGSLSRDCNLPVRPRHAGLLMCRTEAAGISTNNHRPRLNHSHKWLVDYGFVLWLKRVIRYIASYKLIWIA